MWRRAGGKKLGSPYYVEMPWVDDGLEIRQEVLLKSWTRQDLQECAEDRNRVAAQGRDGGRCGG
jgi:hypothetical protein